MQYTEKERKTHLRNWKLSGLSKMAYCQNNNIGYHAFNYWQKRHSSANLKPPSSGQFVNLSSTDQNKLHIELPNGVKIVYEGSLDASLLSLLQNA